MSHTTHRRFTLLLAPALLLVPATLGATAQQVTPGESMTAVADTGEVALRLYGVNIASKGQCTPLP